MGRSLEKPAKALTLRQASAEKMWKIFSFIPPAITARYCEGVHTLIKEALDEASAGDSVDRLLLNLLRIRTSSRASIP